MRKIVEKERKSRFRDHWFNFLVLLRFWLVYVETLMGCRGALKVSFGMANTLSPGAFLYFSAHSAVPSAVFTLEIAKCSVDTAGMCSCTPRGSSWQRAYHPSCHQNFSCNRQISKENDGKPTLGTTKPALDFSLGKKTNRLSLASISTSGEIGVWNVRMHMAMKSG